jgi:hypothetical protein
VEKVHTKDVVTAFLSCSVRPRDWPLVDAIEHKILKPMGFRCFTIGRNISLADQTDDAVRRLFDSCECLIGIATERLTATDRDFPNKTLTIATPYLLQETSMAFQLRLPFLIFRTRGITLQGVTARNLWIEIDGKLHNGRPGIVSKKEMLYSSLRDLKRQALERRTQAGWEQTKKEMGQLSTLLVGGYGTYKGIDWLLRPPCFGDFYYKDSECKGCSYREKCKIQKAQNALK